MSILKITSLHQFTKHKLNVDIPNYHLSQKSTGKIVEAIASCLQNNLLDQINSSEFIGISIDESSDCTQKEILLLYIKYFNSLKNKFEENYIELFELEKTNSETIYETIKQYLIKAKIYDKIIFLCTDGAPRHEFQWEWSGRKNET